jgi:AAA15 family ATPase/GTPase
MIHSLTIKNFFSFKDEVIFSFEATKDKKLENYHVVEAAPGVKLLKLGVVYGANASGKSNLIEAFRFLKLNWENVPKTKDEETLRIPFLLDQNTPNEPTCINLAFFINSTKYNYYLELDNEKIIEESLIFYPGIQPAIIFERKYNNNVSKIEFGAKIKISSRAKEEITLKCLPNMSVFAAYNQVNINIPELKSVLDWISARFMHAIDPNLDLVEYAELAMLKDPQIKQEITEFLKKADFNISGTYFKETVKEIPNPENDNLIDTNANEISINSKRLKTTTKKIEFQHRVFNNKGEEEFYLFPKEFQSAGTLRILGIATAIFQAIQNNAFLAIDEIESKLHPKLIEYVIENFLKHPGQAQLLLSTHYDGLLEEDDLLRKDNIWFTEKNKDGSTKLYSLSDFNAVNRISSLQKAYKYGKFGAVPNIQ